jgi:hypothetical protein
MRPNEPPGETEGVQILPEGSYEPHPPGHSASGWILQVTRRSPEPDSSICLPGLGPLLTLLPQVQAKAPETVHRSHQTQALQCIRPTSNLGRGQMPSTATYPTPRSPSPACQVGTRLSHKLGRCMVWWLDLSLASGAWARGQGCLLRQTPFLAGMSLPCGSITVWPRHPSSGTTVC